MGLYFNKYTKKYYLLLQRFINKIRRAIRSVTPAIGRSSFGRSIRYPVTSILNNTKISRITKFWLAPFILVAIIFIYVKPSFAQLAERDTRLAQFLLEGNLEVGIETVEGFSHGYYVFEGEKTYITEGSLNDKQIKTNGEYITWVKDVGGTGQIFLYHIPTSTTTQLTYSGTNLNPKVNKKGNVVWEGWVDPPTQGSGEAGWQVFVYDGKVIRQITQGDLASHSYIEGDYIVYARKDIAGLWRSEAYSIIDNKTADISLGNETEYPKLVNGEIFLGPPTESQTKFPLKIQDLFLLNLPALDKDINQNTSISEDDILEELFGPLTENNPASESATTNLTPTPQSEVESASNSGTLGN
ncbi:MAG: hypothetical protein UW08_C0013G0002 [Parcubacteria group bacterium GW2011_GWB1_43_8b]|nr:MAG: hypothetical protein UW08_C0013G0002 [Parcubacteria group bacterium GW2011_GWB1_43_8b]